MLRLCPQGLQRPCDSGKLHFAMKNLSPAVTAWVAEQGQALESVFLPIACSRRQTTSPGYVFAPDLLLEMMLGHPGLAEQPLEETEQGITVLYCNTSANSAKEVVKVAPGDVLYVCAAVGRWRQFVLLSFFHCAWVRNLALSLL